MQIAGNPAQASRLAAEIDEELSWKIDGITPLTKAEAAERIRFDGMVSAYHTPHCARIQPAALARGLAETVERLGIDIYENSPVTAIESGRAMTQRGTVSAPIVLRALASHRASSHPGGLSAGLQEEAQNAQVNAPSPHVGGILGKILGGLGG